MHVNNVVCAVYLGDTRYLWSQEGPSAAQSISIGIQDYSLMASAGTNGP